MPVREYVWTGSLWRSLLGDLAPGVIDDGFVLGTTMPTTQNTGIAGAGVSETQLSNYAGSLTNLTGTASRLLITGQWDCQNPNATLRESKIVMGPEPNGGSTGTAGNNPTIRTWYGIRGHQAGVTGIKGEFLDVVPSHPSVDMYGISGGGWELTRCHIQGVVDGAAPYGSSTTKRYARLLGCLIDNLPTYSPDPRQTDGVSHNDGVQCAGQMTLLEVDGCTIYGGTTSCILIQRNAKAGNTGEYDSLKITRNWLRGHSTSGSALNITDAGIPFGPELEIWGNRWLDGSRTGSYLFLLGTATKNQGTAVIHSNTWLDGASAGQSINSTAGG